MQRGLIGRLSPACGRSLSALALRPPCAQLQLLLRPQQHHTSTQCTSSIAEVPVASEAADPVHAALLHQYWEARGVFAEADRSRIVEQTLEALQGGRWEEWAPLPSERLPGLPAAWNMAHGSEEEVLEMSWRLLQLFQLFGGGASVESLVFMVLREPQLLRTPSQELMRRLLEMRVASAGWGIDVVQLVVRQPALLTNAGWEQGSALAALAAARAAAANASSGGSENSGKEDAAGDIGEQQISSTTAGPQIRHARVPGVLHGSTHQEVCEDLYWLAGNDWGSYHATAMVTTQPVPNTSSTAAEQQLQVRTSGTALSTKPSPVAASAAAGLQLTQESTSAVTHSSSSGNDSAATRDSSSSSSSRTLAPAEQMTAAIKARIITRQVASMHKTTSEEGTSSIHHDSSSSSSSHAAPQAAAAVAGPQDNNADFASSAEEAAILSLLRAWEHGLAADGDTEWKARLQQLAEYVAEHGDASVGFRDEFGEEQALGRWAAKQRADSRRGQLPEHRRAALELLGFEFNEDEAEWVRWYTALQQFKEANGHCSPWPLAQGVDLRLINWASIQRQARRAHVLPDDRIVRLDQLGFDWTGADPLS